MLSRITSIVVIGMVVSGSAYARWKSEYSNNSPQIQQWFQEQKDSKGRSCCTEADGHSFDGNYEFTADGSVIVYENGNKYFIEKDKVLHGNNPTSRAVWFYIGDGPGRTSYCFSPGSMG